MKFPTIIAEPNSIWYDDKSSKTECQQERCYFESRCPAQQNHIKLSKLEDNNVRLTKQDQLKIDMWTMQVTILKPTDNLIHFEGSTGSNILIQEIRINKTSHYLSFFNTISKELDLHTRKFRLRFIIFLSCLKLQGLNLYNNNKKLAIKFNNLISL